MRVLSIDGGGYLGLATATFIDGVERHFGVRLAEQFDLFCGTSTGAILALALATGKSGRELVELYRGLGASVFGSWGGIRNALRTARWIVAPKYSNSGLRQALADTFGDRTLGDLPREKRVLITSYCTSTGRPRIFKTDHSPNLTRHSGYRLADVALASSSAPTYFPLVRIPDPLTGAIETFCDGGIVANAPALLGYVEAVHELRSRPGDVRLLSLSTPRTDLSEDPTRRPRLDRGAVAWVLGGLISAQIDSGSFATHQVLSRLVASHGPADGPLYVRHELVNRHALPIDRADAVATDALTNIGAADASSNEVRARLAPFFIPR